MNFSQPKEEEWYVNNSSEQCCELFDFGIKAFGKSIGRAVHEEVQDSVIRPACYSATGDQQLLVSPGALDMAGLIVTPRKEDFEK